MISKAYIIAFFITGIFIIGSCTQNTSSTKDELSTLLNSFCKDASNTKFFTQEKLSMNNLMTFIDQVSDTINQTEDTMKKLDILIHAVYSRQQIVFDREMSDLEGMLPQLTYRSKKGRCLGIGLIMLLVAEKTDMPLYGVHIPGHFFLRYDTANKQYRNVEPNKHGVSHPDKYYKQQYHITHSHEYAFRNLSPEEVCGMLYYNMGIALMKEQQYKKAEEFFIEATNLYPSKPQIYGNLAILYTNQKKYDNARSMFQKCWEVDPYLDNLYLNYGRFEESRKNLESALKIYRKGTQIFPGKRILKDRVQKIAGILGK